MGAFMANLEVDGGSCEGTGTKAEDVAILGTSFVTGFAFLTEDYLESVLRPPARVDSLGFCFVLFLFMVNRIGTQSRLWHLMPL